jgi:hypothetical protein
MRRSRRNNFLALGFDPSELKHTPLIPAQAGIQGDNHRLSLLLWVPAFAGTSGDWPIQSNSIKL